MNKFLLIAVLITLGCKLITGRWPWQFLVPTSTRAQARFRARKLLAVRENAGREEILEAHRRLLTLVHPDKGGSNAQVHEANAARDLLLADLTDGT